VAATSPHFFGRHSEVAFRDNAIEGLGRALDLVQGDAVGEHQELLDAVLGRMRAGPCLEPRKMNDRPHVQLPFRHLRSHVFESQHLVTQTSGDVARTFWGHKLKRTYLL
jgi:hypothetical protein